LAATARRVSVPCSPHDPATAPHRHANPEPTADRLAGARHRGIRTVFDPASTARTGPPARGGCAGWVARRTPGGDLRHRRCLSRRSRLAGTAGGPVAGRVPCARSRGQACTRASGCGGRDIAAPRRPPLHPRRIPSPPPRSDGFHRGGIGRQRRSRCERCFIGVDRQRHAAARPGSEHCHASPCSAKRSLAADVLWRLGRRRPASPRTPPAGLSPRGRRARPCAPPAQGLVVASTNFWMPGPRTARRRR
jgi:hypothetical protein